MNERQRAIDIFLAGVESVRPENLLRHYISIGRNILQIEKLSFDLSEIKNIYIIGAGKASAAMAQTIESIFGYRITAEHIITKYKHSVPLKFIEITEAGHPVPDKNGIRGTKNILSIAKRADKNDLVICLISGGGSALLADVPEGCTLEDVKKVNSVLLKIGADITEMNCIRKHLSGVKGGQLSRAASPAKIVSLILSDVIGDPPDVIASGPTAADPTTFAQAISIIKKHNIENQIPEQINKILEEGCDGKRQETVKESDEVLLHTHNLVIGSNILALNAAKAKAESLGYNTRIITNRLAADVSDVAQSIVETARGIKEQNKYKKTCLLFGGEPTVKVEGKGSGGRNQHLALLIASLIKGLPGITVLSGGTDGTDGPTDAAGAVVDCFTSEKAMELQLNPEEYINDSDSYNFFKKVSGLVITGPTQTNVMDLIVVLVELN